MQFFKATWDTVTEWLKAANGYSFPISLIVVAVILNFLIRRGMKWTVRQTYYVEILKNLGMWNDSLRDRLDYFVEPGSEYRADPESQHFSNQATKG